MDKTSLLPRIVYVSPVSFLKGGAAARRMLGISQSLRAAGYEVLIGSGQLPDNTDDYPMQYESFPVYPLSERTAEQCPTIIKHMLYFTMGKKTVCWLESLSPRPVAVILYSGYSPYFVHLLPWCERRGIPLIFDAVEWYDPTGMPGGRFGPYRWNIELAMRYYCVRVGRLIVISSYLENYYRARGCATVRIPPTLDVLGTTPNLEPSADGIVTIGYTGNPEKKDLFNTILEGLLCVDPAGRSICLRVAGVTHEKLLTYPAIVGRRLAELPPGIETVGFVPHSEAIDLIRHADFSVLLRPPLRYAQAGFPTKVVESLSLGTPVICNLTSDLGDHIRDGQEGIICRDYQVDSLVDAFTRVTALSTEQRRVMRLAARRQAEQAFDHRQFVASLTQFLQQIMNKR